MTHELQHKYRPKRLVEVIGQESATKLLNKFLKSNTLPHALLLTGPSGCGKTTIARILKDKLNCSDLDFKEINAADTRGIDTIREIKSRTKLSPAKGACRMWLIDEAHKLSNDAQNAMLKLIEDVPTYVYFILCTTDPHKIITTIRTRCTRIDLEALTDTDLNNLLTSIVTKEKIAIGEEVIDKIIEVARGSARQAVVDLNKALQLDTDADRLSAIVDPKDESQAFDLVKALVYDRPNWFKVANILKSLQIGNREQFRRFVLACARTIMLKADKSSGRAFLVLDVFQKPWYGYEETGLEHACYEICMQKS